MEHALDGENVRRIHLDSASHRECFLVGPASQRDFQASRAIRSSLRKCVSIVGLYLDPPERALVLCVDEKGRIQALDRTQPLLPLRPGQIERRTHDDERHGTTTLFAALDVKAGTIVGKCMPRHRAQEFRKFLKRCRARATDLEPARRHGQRVEPQDQTDPQLVRQAFALARPLHADVLILGQSGRALLRAFVRTADQARRT